MTREEREQYAIALMNRLNELVARESPPGAGHSDAWWEMVEKECQAGREAVRRFEDGEVGKEEVDRAVTDALWAFRRASRAFRSQGKVA